MDSRMAQDLDNHITGHYGEDQYEKTVELPLSLLEEIRDYLSQQMWCGNMETHRAEADGVDHLLAGVVELLAEATP